MRSRSSYNWSATYALFALSLLEDQHPPTFNFTAIQYPSSLNGNQPWRGRAISQMMGQTCSGAVDGPSIVDVAIKDDLSWWREAVVKRLDPWLFDHRTLASAAHRSAKSRLKRLRYL